MTLWVLDYCAKSTNSWAKPLANLLSRRVGDYNADMEVGCSGEPHRSIPLFTFVIFGQRIHEASPAS